MSTNENIETVLANKKIMPVSSHPHDLVSGDVGTVSGLSTDTLRGLDGWHQIGFGTSFLRLSTGIGTTSATGIITSISLSGDLYFNPVTPNDVLGITTERFLVLSVDDVNGKIKVKRQFDGVIGTAHTSGSIAVSYTHLTLQTTPY